MEEPVKSEEQQPANTTPTDNTTEKATAELKTAEPAKVPFSHFLQLDLRTAQIVGAEKIEKSAKLVKLQLDLGEKLGTRQIVAGVGKNYTPEQLIGRKIVIVANLEPAKLMGEVSNGMLLAATTDDGFLELVSISPEAPLGARVS